MDGAGPREPGSAEVQLTCAELAPALDFFVGRLGFRVEAIFPADAPSVASLSGHGLRLRLAPEPGGAGVIRLPCAGPLPAPSSLTAPNGTRIDWVAADPPVELPPLAPAFVFTRADVGEGAHVGRAGMTYRDLIPDRQGGRFIASHISIPGGGPVSDWVHFHKIRFQMIFCRRGWVRVAYEDQGEPIVMRAGDCVVQPPRIRHRVLEASAGLEVVEIGCPARHETLADHAMTLPTGRTLPERDFGGQRFLFHVAAECPWQAGGAGGFERRETGIDRATGGLADARVLRPPTGQRAARSAAFDGHGHELLFGFLLEGSARLAFRGRDHGLGPADAFVIPPGEPWALSQASDDLELLQVRVG